jgi:hypothetical protein
MRIATLSLFAALWATAAVAADEPMSTAGAGSAPPASTETAAQIEQWIADSPTARPEPDLPLANGPRKIHGEVGVSVGTGGYRSGYVITHIPIGETGSATIALSKTDHGDRVRYGPIGYGPADTPFD